MRTRKYFFLDERLSSKGYFPPPRKYLIEGQNNCFDKSFQADYEEEKAKKTVLLQEKMIIQRHEKSKLLLKKEPLETSTGIITVAVRHATLGCPKRKHWRTDTFTQVYY